MGTNIGTVNANFEWFCYIKSVLSIIVEKWKLMLEISYKP